MSDQRDRVVLVGAGRVASHLAPALAATRYAVAGVWSRTQAHAAEVAASAGAEAFSGSLRELPQAHIYIICVADDAIPAVATALCPLHPDALFLHTAGSVPMSVFAGAGARRYGVLYPLQTFSRERAVNFRSVPLFVEGNTADARRETTGLASVLSRQVRRLGSEERRHVHLAAVFACNFVNHCCALAAEEMDAGALPFHWLEPLISETLRKVRAERPAAVQTGPAVRGDRGVMERQAALLRHAESRAVYEAMSRSIARVARKEAKRRAAITNEKNND